jgi:hypothetical protein
MSQPASSSKSGSCGSVFCSESHAAAIRPTPLTTMTNPLMAPPRAPSSTVCRPLPPGTTAARRYHTSFSAGCREPSVPRSAVVESGTHRCAVGSPVLDSRGAAHFSRIRVTVPSVLFATQTLPSLTAIAAGSFPTVMAFPTTLPVSASIRVTVLSMLLATQTLP